MVAANAAAESAAMQAYTRELKEHTRDSANRSFGYAALAGGIVLG